MEVERVAGDAVRQSGATGSFAIAPTDLGWFDFMRDAFRGEVANFWTPTPWNVRSLAPGDRFYFMLKAPIRKLGGYGLFKAYREMTAVQAWETYGPGNGVNSAVELRAKVEMFAERRSAVPRLATPTIGCIELTGVVTLSEAEYVTPDSFGQSFPAQVVKFKRFNGPDTIAAGIGSPSAASAFSLVSGAPDKALVSRKHRPGQAAFRRTILANYEQKCCITDETIVDLLEASHLQPYINRASDHPQNGICLRVDVHRLFDAGLITIDAGGKVVVAARLKGTAYEALAGRSMRFARGQNAPSTTALDHHRRVVFRP